MSIGRACAATRLSRTAWYRRPRSCMERDRAVIEVLNALVARRPRWGFWKLYDRSRLEGHAINHKTSHRVYCALRLNLPRRTKRRVPKRLRQPLCATATERDLGARFHDRDALQPTHFRIFNVIDESNREGLGIEVACRSRACASSASTTADRSTAVRGGAPRQRPRVDRAGPFVDWCAELSGSRRTTFNRVNRIRTCTSNASIARATGTEVLNAHLFESIAELRALTNEWLRIYNQELAARQPRPGAAPDLSAEARNGRSVSLGTVRLTGELTGSACKFGACSTHWARKGTACDYIHPQHFRSMILARSFERAFR